MIVIVIVIVMVMVMVVVVTHFQPTQQGRDDQADERREIGDERHRDRQELRVGQIEFEKIQQ